MRNPVARRVAQITRFAVPQTWGLQTAILACRVQSTPPAGFVNLRHGRSGDLRYFG